MLRRYVSLLVIMGLFASQLAAMPHAHAGATTVERQKHDSTPHFHLHWFEDGHDHAHCSGGHKHSHDSLHDEPLHGDSPAQEPTGDSQAQPLSNGLSSASHDANAIFVPVCANAFSVTSQDASPTTALQFVTIATLVNLLEDAWSCMRSTRPVHPPDAAKDGSDIYLTLRNLRI